MKEGGWGICKTGVIKDTDKIILGGMGCDLENSGCNAFSRTYLNYNCGISMLGIFYSYNFSDPHRKEWKCLQYGFH